MELALSLPQEPEGFAIDLELERGGAAVRKVYSLR